MYETHSQLASAEPVLGTVCVNWAAMLHSVRVSEIPRWSSVQPQHHHHQRTSLDLVVSHSQLLDVFDDWTRHHPHPATDETVVELTQLLILHPGNPGVAQFYVKFVEAICQLLPTLGVVVVGYAGQSLACNADHEHTYGLQEQVEAADRVVNILLNSAASYVNGVYCAGHSIGAYIAMQMMARHEQLKFAFMLAPTILHMAQSPNGRDPGKRMLLARAGTWITSRVVTPVLQHVVPDRVKKLLVKKVQVELDDAGADVVVGMMKGRVVRNILTMARTEFFHIDSLDIPLLEKLQHRLVFYFVPNDGWVPMTDVAIIRAHAANAAGWIIEEEGKACHAWCLDASEVVAARIAPFFATGPATAPAPAQEISTQDGAAAPPAPTE